MSVYPEIENSNLKSFQNGEEKGFEFFFRLYYKSLCFFANRYVQDMPAAEDVVSEVFMRVWERRDSIESAAGLKSYLYKSVYHGCLREKSGARSRESALRQAQGDKQLAVGSPEKSGQVLQLSAAQEKSYLDTMIRAEVMNEVYVAIEKLPKECKKIFTKIFLEGKTVKEIAEELSLSVSTVKTQKARALNFLRTKLSPMCVTVLISTLF